MGTVDKIARCKWPKSSGEQDAELRRHFLYDAGMLNRALGDWLFRVAEDGVTGVDFEDGAIPESKFDVELQAQVGLDDGAVTLQKLANGVLAASTAGRLKMADLFLQVNHFEDEAVTEAELDSGVGAFAVPVGAMLPYGGESLPGDDWLWAAGQVLNIADWPALYVAIGTLWGVGGTGTFKAPDGRGFFVRGWAHTTSVDPDRATRRNDAGVVVGDRVGSVQVDALVAHTHAVTAARVNPSALAGPSFVQVTNSNNASFTVNANGASFETRPLNKAVGWIVKAR